MGSRKGTLAAMLKEQGFGTHKECMKLVRGGLVGIGRETGDGTEWRTAEDPEERPAPEGLRFKVGDLDIPYAPQLYLAFHKPAGTECSHSPSHHQSIYSFFPDIFLRRSLEAVGRLDADTTGLLLLTDSGRFNHFFTSPRRHVPKTYLVGTKHPITPEQIAKLTEGVELRHEDGLTLPARVEIIDDRQCHLTIMEGKYHQVKRMFAAAGNRVETIHRLAIGSLKLDEGLAPGQWRRLRPDELEILGFGET